MQKTLKVDTTKDHNIKPDNSELFLGFGLGK